MRYVGTLIGVLVLCDYVMCFWVSTRVSVRGSMGSSVAVSNVDNRMD